NVAQYEQKIKEIKENLNTVIEEPSVDKTASLSSGINKEQQTKERIYEIEKNDSEIEPVVPQLTSTDTVYTQPDTKAILNQTSVSTATQQEEKNISEEGILIYTILIYPSTVSETKNIFFENINSTFSRVSKAHIKLTPLLCIEYDSIEKDLLTQFDNIVDKTKHLSNVVLFLVINEAITQEQSVNEFINKISFYVNMAKVINFRELKMKSMYLDIAIDLLLNLPQFSKV
ncbi:MAG: hypothetical protein N2Z73_01660, partial [Endomicrobia bacterium]|nr:hypothetical protein [Endomicrobiia bacterium]